MHTRSGSSHTILFRLIASLVPFLTAIPIYARVGGAGGHGSHGGGGGMGGHFGGGGGIGYAVGSGMGMGGIIFLIVLAIIIYYLYQKYGGETRSNSLLQEDDSSYSNRRAIPFPPGLEPTKITQAFLEIQKAWQDNNLGAVRKWISDGMYQRLSTQFHMMQALGQKNTISNIRILDMRVDALSTDSALQTADVRITFRINDSFVSSTHPEFNESYPDDEDAEIWSFVKRLDAKADKDLYSTDNCPNCGAPLSTNLGEISRCSSCGTLTNSAAYDWVLAEITQDEDYNGPARLASDQVLKTMMKDDPQFSVQRVEDIASNIFMQVMEVLTGKDEERLNRFADTATATSILNIKHKLPPFLFDRLYLNYMELVAYQDISGMIRLQFDLAATYRRVSQSGKMQMMDDDFVTRQFMIELRRKAKPLTAAAGETVFSYECSSCGAPFTDTTNDRCSYCEALVVDTERNWVLTAFEWRTPELAILK